MSNYLKSLAKENAVTLKIELGNVFEPRFFCCTNPNALAIEEGKTPVCNLELFPNPCFVGESVTFDATNSYDPDGTVTNYQWTFPGGTPSSSTSPNGTVTWAAEGTYRVKLIVRDGTSLSSSPCEVDVDVVQPSGEYYMAADSGVYYTNDGGQNWQQKNGSLTGSSLDVRSIAIDPKGVVWIATKGGVYASADNGSTWNNQTPSVAGREAQEFDVIHFGPQDIFVAAHLGANQAWIYYSPDFPTVRTSPSTPITWQEFTEAPP